MATLLRRNERFYCQFQYHGKRHTLTVGKVDEDEATHKAAQVDYLLMRLKQRLIALPPGVDIVQFMLWDGKLPATVPASKDEVTLDQLRSRYLTTHGNGTLEASTLSCIKVHFKHWAATLGAKFPMATLGLAELQRHVDRRARMKGRNGKRLSPTTVKKEIVSLRTAWNWARRMEFVTGPFPNAGLRYPKTDEKPPFQTRAEIEQAIKAERLNEQEQQDRWECLYLTVDEMSELLTFLKVKDCLPWVYPLVATALYTGARRSELIRARVTDVDLDGAVITIRERKRVHSQRTTRRVPMSDALVKILRTWLAEHPGGPWLFAQSALVFRSKTKRIGASAITRDEAHDHFKRALRASKWDKIRGLHTCRHSFVSACASRGIDQRLVESFAGHMSKETSARYAHHQASGYRRGLCSGSSPSR